MPALTASRAAAETDEDRCEPDRRHAFDLIIIVSPAPPGSRRVPVARGRWLLVVRLGLSCPVVAGLVATTRDPRS